MPRRRHPSPTRRLRHFFNVWDVVEQMHPWGVERLQPMLADFDVPAALCAEIDSRLFFDLMIARQPDVQRVRVEGRHSGVVFWAQFEGLASDAPDAHISVAFQRTPAHGFDCRAEVAASPRALVGCLAAHHRVVLMGEGRRWCSRGVASGREVVVGRVV